MNPTDDRHRTSDDPCLPVAAETPSRRPYRAPRLESLGDLRGMTFGGSPGLNDSGSELTQEPPGGL